MTDDEIRIAIAEACPNIVELNDGEWCWAGSWRRFLPLTDLNAINEAKKTLTDDEYDRFEAICFDMALDELPLAPLEFRGEKLPVVAGKGQSRPLCLSARKQCIAYLRVKRKDV